MKEIDLKIHWRFSEKTRQGDKNGGKRDLQLLKR